MNKQLKRDMKTIRSREGKLRDILKYIELKENENTNLFSDYILEKCAVKRILYVIELFEHQKNEEQLKLLTKSAFKDFRLLSYVLRQVNECKRQESMTEEEKAHLRVTGAIEQIETLLDRQQLILSAEGEEIYIIDAKTGYRDNISRDM